MYVCIYIDTCVYVYIYMYTLDSYHFLKVFEEFQVLDFSGDQRKPIVVFQSAKGCRYTCGHGSGSRYVPSFR